jgi:hypothetical protein
MDNVSIYIYIPQYFWPKFLPDDPNENWPGFGLGMYTWTIKTYLHLRSINFPCQLVNYLPKQGIILIDHNHLRSQGLKPNQKQLFVCLEQDGLPYPYAQLSVVQNPIAAQLKESRYYIPHWPQPGLLPRYHDRGVQFENVGFFGHEVNLAAELKNSRWQRDLCDLGLKWCPVINCNHWSDYSSLDARWNDYSEIDVMVAIRSFRNGEKFLHKPASKLYNAWLAKVPAILGVESAFRAEGEPGLNYLEVSSYEQLLQALRDLKNDSSFCHQLVHQGFLRGQDFLADQTVKRWANFLQEIAVPAYKYWCAIPPVLQRTFLESNWINCKLQRAYQKTKNLLINREHVTLTVSRSTQERRAASKF